jgi:hypothetical protein
MSQLHTQLNPRAADFAANAQAMRAFVDDLNLQVQQAQQGGGEAARAKHVARGKLLPRDRVQMLLDPGTPFLELAPLAALHAKCDARCSHPCGQRRGSHGQAGSSSRARVEEESHHGPLKPSQHRRWAEHDERGGCLRG